MTVPEDQVEKVTLTIDGQEVTVPKGTLIIRAAEQLGTIIPRFCDHPLLDPVGACRQCVVEVEGQRKPVMSCTQPVAPDMEVRTHLTDAVARKAQEGTLEFLLINHPLDCPMCDKGGECPLQDQALRHGANTSRFIDQKRRYDKPLAISAQVLLDRERCVLCARCTRFAEQISGEPFIELFERSALEQVAIYEDEPYDSYFSGNIIQICPVGALTSADYRFKARPFDVVTTPSVCDHCSAGCTLTVQSRRGDVQRQLARTNMAVNEAWNCDKGRFGYHHLAADQRVIQPLIREEGALGAVSWTDALLRVSSAITAANERGPGRVAVVTGSRLADEDAYAAAKYARMVLGTDDVDYRTRFAPPSEIDELTALVARSTATYADVEAAPVLVVAGLDSEEEVPILHLRIRKAWRAHKARIVVVGPHLGSLAGLAWRHVPTMPGEEAAALVALVSDDGELGTALRDVQGAVVIVGERAGAGSVTAAAGLADAVDGSYAYVPRRAGARGALEAGLAAGALPGGRRLDDPTDRADVEALWGTLPTERGRDLQGILEAAAAGEIDVLHLIGVDLVRDAASPALADAALAKVGTVVTQDLAMTATLAAHADVVLPAAGTQERAGSYTNWEGRTQRFARAIVADDLVLDDWAILVQLAAVQGHDLGFSDLDALRGEIARLGLRATPHGFPQADPTVSPNLSTDGPAERSDEVGFAVVARPQLLDHGTMLTGAEDLLRTARTPVVVVNALDAASLGIADGDLVEITSAHGGLRLVASVGHDVIPGVVVLPTNSTDEPLGTLADRSGALRVALTPIATEGQDDPDRARAAEEVA